MSGCWRMTPGLHGRRGIVMVLVRAGLWEAAFEVVQGLVRLGVKGRRGPWSSFGMTTPDSVHDRAQARRVSGLGLPAIDPDEHVVAGVADQPHRQGPAVQVVPTADLGAELYLRRSG